MAPVPLDRPLSYIPLAITGAHLSLVFYLTYAVGASLYTSYKALSPSQDTRQRSLRRTKLAPIFVGLAIAALASAVYCSVSYAALSYRVWADERRIELEQTRLLGEDLEELPSTWNPSQRLQLARWLSETPIYLDALEIVAEKARRFWWSQQIDLATISWGMLLAIEGRRRRIRLLPAFLALAHLVNLSFAQNLFYLALLFTPSPLPSQELELPVPPTTTLHRLRDNVIPAKPANWYPYPSLILGALVLNIGAVFMLPFSAGTPSFFYAVVIARATTILPLLLPMVAPVSWGRVHPHPHTAYRAFTMLFRYLAVATFVLHGKATFLGLSYNTPDSHYHRHSRFIPWDVEERSTWERTTSALGKVLGSTSDHPVVAAAGWDVLLSTVSLGLWAAIRATDIRDILASAIPFYKSRALPTSGEEEEEEEEEVASRTNIKSEPDASDSEHSTTLRRRRRHRRSLRKGSIASSNGASEDTETTPSPRKRGSPKKDPAEKAYEPTPAVAQAVVEGDVLPTEDLDWESAALAWGLTAVGGLGCSSAGVFGGECIAR